MSLSLAGKSNHKILNFLFIHNKWTNVWHVCLLICVLAIPATAQKADTANRVPIEIVAGNNTNLEFITTDSGGITKLINNVALKQGETLMYCDSAYIDRDKNNMQAFGNVRIVQTGGTEVQSDYLKYTGNTKKAYLKDNVSLTDGKNNLWSNELEYDVGTRIGTYTQGGTLQSETTTLSSNRGMYNANTKDTRFTSEVYVTDPQYTVTSEDLGYNTESRIVTFFGPSVVTSDKSVLHTSSGTWDAKNEVAHFTDRSSIINAEQFIEADQLNYNKKTGYGTAKGNVVAIDTIQKTTLYCGYVQYNQRSRKSLASVNPVMKKMNGEDSLFIRADTFYSAPVRIPKKDTAHNKTKTASRETRMEKKQLGKNIIETVVADEDTLTADSKAPRYFTGYHHVLVFSDSMQAKCDSISYSQADSTMRMMYDPVAWSRNSQISGDTILLYMDSSKLRRAYVPNNAFVVSRSGPIKAQMFDQVQGKTLTAYFENNAIHEVVVWPNAESIYYSRDEAGAYLGVNQAQSERMKVFFDSSDISRIVLEQDIKQTMTPMTQVSIPSLRLSRFQWFEDKRPKSVKELFEFPLPASKDAAKQAETEEKMPTNDNRERKERR